MAPDPATPAPAATPQHTKQAAIEAHLVVFTGTGAEYFRVWVVNVLLSIVTLSLYTPWARRRTAQYFYGHTQVADSPLEFVADLRRMVFGFMVYFALYLAYELAVYTEQELATTLLATGFAVLTPFVWGSAMRFRYRATRWRGIRLAFTASWKEVYLASWPMFAVAALWIGLSYAADTLVPEWMEPAEPSMCPRPPDTGKAPAQPVLSAASLFFPSRVWLMSVPPAAWVGLGLASLVSLFCVIRLDYNYTRLRIARMRLGGHTGRWKLGYGSFVKVWLAAVAILVVTLAIFFAAVAGLMRVTGGMSSWMLSFAHTFGWLLASILILVVVSTGLVLASLPARAWREARLFQLVWNHAGLGQIARTRTALRTGPYMWLRFKNVVLSFLTLGFYRPFAVTSEYAAKVGSVTLYLKGDIDHLRGELVEQQGGLGDAAADAFGLDLIG